MSESNKLSGLTDQQLTDAYVELSRQQGEALLKEDTRKYNRPFDRVDAIGREHRKRGDDVRKTQLAPLHKLSSGESRIDWGTAQRRYNAAMDLMAVAPDLAKATLEGPAKGPLQDYVVRAGMSLLNLERGRWKPR